MMTPLRHSRFSMLPGLLVWVLALAPLALAHQEPIKTQSEKAERERSRRKMERLAVKSQHAWLLPATNSGKSADSILQTTINFDPTGHAIEERQFDSSHTATTVEVYDTSGLWVEELTYDSDSLEGRSRIIYDQQGFISRVQDFDASGTMTGQLQYRTVEKDNLIVAEKRTASDSLLYRIDYSYEPGSQFARQAGAAQYGADGALKMRTRSIHEGDHRIQKFVFGPEGELEFSFEYRYTADGDYQEIIRRDPKGAIILRQVFEYNADGLLIGCTDFNADGAAKRTIRYHYEFYDRPRH